MGGMVAQELAILLLPQRRLLSLGLAVTCRGLKPLGGLLTPLVKPQVGSLPGPYSTVSHAACESSAALAGMLLPQQRLGLLA